MRGLRRFGAPKKLPAALKKALAVLKSGPSA